MMHTLLNIIVIDRFNFHLLLLIESFLDLFESHENGKFADRAFLTNLKNRDFCRVSKNINKKNFKNNLKVGR